MEGSILTVLCYFFMWSTMYFTLCLINSKRSYEWHCRTVTAIHGITVTCLSAWSGFIQGPWPFVHAGGPNTPLQAMTMEICLGYFLFDFTWCLYFSSEGAVMLLHHLVSILALTVATITGDFGTEMNAAIFGSEATNPLLQWRWFLKESNRYDTLLGEIVDHAFVLLFGFLRIGVGTCLLYYYFQMPTSYLGRFSGSVLYAISWLFWISIVQYGVHKYKKKFKKWKEIADAKKQDLKTSNSNGHIDLTNDSFCNKTGSDSNLTNRSNDLNMNKPRLNDSLSRNMMENGGTLIADDNDGFIKERQLNCEAVPST